MIRSSDGQEGDKEDLASVVVEKTQDHASIFAEISVAAGSTAAARQVPAELSVPLGPCRIRGLLQPRSPQAWSSTLWDLYPFIQTDS